MPAIRSTKQTTATTSSPAHAPLLNVAALFPGRTVLTIKEVVRCLGINEQHAVDLVAAGDIGAVNIGGGGSGRKYWRIPVAELQRFIDARASK